MGFLGSKQLLLYCFECWCSVFAFHFLILLCLCGFDSAASRSAQVSALLFSSLQISSYNLEFTLHIWNYQITISVTGVRYVFYSCFFLNSCSVQLKLVIVNKPNRFRKCSGFQLHHLMNLGIILKCKKSHFFLTLS